MAKESDGCGVPRLPESEVQGHWEMYYPIKVHVSDAQPSI